MRELEKSQRFGMWEGRWGRAASALAGEGGDWGSDAMVLPGPPKISPEKGPEGFFFPQNPGSFPMEETSVRG